MLDSHFPVVDLHCDLLSSLLHEPQTTAFTANSRCSLPQLLRGGVAAQACAIFVETHSGSVEEARAQAKIFAGLPNAHPEHLQRMDSATAAVAESDRHSNPIRLLAAIENASGLCEESAPLQTFYDNLSQIEAIAGPLLYIGLTWGQENRFGGGNNSSVGLKPEGREVLRYMSERNIAVDFAHTSDALAYDILNFIEKENLALAVLASHSNFREICDVARNLPTDVALELIRRGGVIGLNLVQPFVGIASPSSFARQVEFGLTLPGAADALCIGADFFNDNGLEQYYGCSFFFEEFADASSYPALFELLQKQTCLDLGMLRALSHGNALRFIQRQLGHLGSA
jgi:membrane dipeptidase